MRLYLTLTILALALPLGMGSGCDTPGAEGAYYVPEPEPVGEVTDTTDPEPEPTEPVWPEKTEPWWQEETEGTVYCEPVLACYVMSGGYLCCSSLECVLVPHRIEVLCTEVDD